MTRTWMVRCGGKGRLYDTFRDRRIVGLGWEGVGDLTNVRAKEEIFLSLKNALPSNSDQSNFVSAGLLFRFRNEVQIGDRVVTYDPGSRRYACGTVSGDYQHDPAASDEALANVRSVLWSHETLRDSLTLSARNTLGSTLTIFSIPDAISAALWDETPPALATAQDTLPAAAATADASLSAEGAASQAREAIKDRLVALDWKQMQELVAGILRAMGYKTEISPVGADRGKDIIASPDGFGFQEPRIFVEVKHRPNERIGSPEIRSFVGGRHPGDKGLYVSTGGYTTDARYEAERARIPVTLLDFERLVEAILEYYDDFDQETRQLLPLRAIYWPIT